MFTAIIYGSEIKAKTLKGLKCKASKIANNYRKSVDEMVVTISEKVQGFPKPVTFNHIRTMELKYSNECST